MIGRCEHGKLRNIQPYKASGEIRVACDFRCQKMEEEVTITPVVVIPKKPYVERKTTRKKYTQKFKDFIT